MGVAVNKYRKIIIFLVIAAVLITSSGCSPNSLKEKLFGKAKATSNLTADFVYVDEPATTKAVTDMINNAKNSIYVEQYEFDRRDLMDLLIDKARQGIEVKVLLDQSSKSAKSTYDYFRANGVDVRFYPTQKGQLSKAKLLAVDNSRALVAGNEWTEAARPDHDVALELDGWSGWKAAWIFARDWKFATTNDLNVGESSLPADNVLLAANPNIQSLVTRQMQEAKQSILIEIPLLTYPPELLNQLADFAASGKHVQIILDPTQKVNQYTITKLKASGVQIRLYPSDDQHQLAAKFAVVDGTSAIMGSANWTRSTFSQNHELDVLVPSKAVSEKFTQLFNQDWQKSKDAEVKGPNSQALPQQ